MDKHPRQFRRFHHCRCAIHDTRLIGTGLINTRIGIAEALGQLLRHIRVAALQITGNRHGDRRAAMRTHPCRVNLLLDPLCRRLIYDPRPALLIHADDICRASNQFGVRAQIIALRILQPLYRTALDLGLIALRKRGFQALIISSCLDLPFRDMGLHFAGFFDHAVSAQDLFAFQQSAKLHVHIIENIPRLFQIRPALEVQILGHGYLGEIIGNPLMLECCILRPCFHAGDHFRRADPGSAQRRIDPCPQLWLGKSFQLALLNIGLRIHPAL